jgi:alpha-galactosidase
MVGWSSSFNYKNNISENIILDNLQNFKIKKLKVDFIQIDDGWQSNVGDWLTPNNTFQKGMSYLAYAIHEQGVKAGLWLAPFIVEKESTIFKNKKNWLLTDNNGNPIIIGKSKQWSGEFYALDFYNKEVQEHMTGIVYTILNKWGFDFIKFDYLYAVCATHPPQKTRGQIMHDTMVFLRNLCGDKWMISSKVPLGSAFGLTDYCQVCSNIHTSWENNLDSFLQVRERASTISALRSLLNRWQLNGRAFQNTDNVFIINNKNHKLKDNQVETLSSLNGLLSSLSTTSDWAKYYEDDNIENYNAHFNYKNCQINHIQLRGDDLYEIIFTNDGIKQVCIVNLSNKKVNYRNLELDPFKTLFDDF